MVMMQAFIGWISTKFISPNLSFLCVIPEVVPFEWAVTMEVIIKLIGECNVEGWKIGSLYVLYWF